MHDYYVDLILLHKSVAHSRWVLCLFLPLRKHGSHIRKPHMVRNYRQPVGVAHNFQLTAEKIGKKKQTNPEANNLTTVRNGMSPATTQGGQ